MEVRCEMLAMKEWLREPSLVVYSRCCVLDAPSDIPDGSYTVFFDRHSVSAVRQGGLWLPHDHADPLPLEACLEMPNEPAFRMEDAIEILPLLGTEAA